MQKQLTISNTFQNRRYNKYVIVPAIRVQGKWLMQLGFTAGDKVQLVCKKNKLIITRLEE
jgi:toxic protein SymE